MFNFLRNYVMICKKYNSIFHSDVAQSLGTQKVDVVEMNIDWFADCYYIHP